MLRESQKEIPEHRLQFTIASLCENAIHYGLT